MLLAIINLIREMREQGFKVHEIISSTASIPEWIHFIEFQDKYYITFNTYDILAALKLIGTSIEMARVTMPAIFDVPYQHDDDEACLRVMKGVFLNSVRIGHKSRP